MIIIDITFVLIFLVGFFGLCYKITQKIPELVAIPDQVIVERLHEDSAKVRLFILHIKTFYQEAKHKEAFWKIVGKVLYKFHIAVLRIDNSIVRTLKKIKTAGVLNGNGNENGNEEYWKQLQDGPPTFTPLERRRPLSTVSGYRTDGSVILPSAERKAPALTGFTTPKSTHLHEARKKKI